MFWKKKDLIPEVPLGSYRIIPYCIDHGQEKYIVEIYTYGRLNYLLQYYWSHYPSHYHPRFPMEFNSVDDAKQEYEKYLDLERKEKEFCKRPPIVFIKKE